MARERESQLMIQIHEIASDTLLSEIEKKELKMTEAEKEIEKGKGKEKDTVKKKEITEITEIDEIDEIDEIEKMEKEDRVAETRIANVETATPTPKKKRGAPRNETEAKEGHCICCSKEITGSSCSSFSSEFYFAVLYN